MIWLAYAPGESGWALVVDAVAAAVYRERGYRITGPWQLAHDLAHKAEEITA